MDGIKSAEDGGRVQIIAGDIKGMGRNGNSYHFIVSNCWLAPSKGDIGARPKHMESSAATKQTSRKRQCWECHRRRLVCGSERPACKKCVAAGVDCPGYDEKKPLKWLPPGKVTSRTRRRQRPPASQTNGHTTTLAIRSSNAGASSRKGATLGAEVMPHCAEMKAAEVPLPVVDLIDETTVMMHTVYYYNFCIYPDFASMHELAPNPYLIRFAFDAVYLIPEGIRHSLIWLALNHRIHKLLPTTDRSALMPARSSLLHHRGVAIRVMGKDLDKPATRTNDATITSVLLFLFAEIRDPISPDWRLHFGGAAKLIMLRGGPRKVFSRCPIPETNTVIGNTTSPPSEQIPTGSHLDLMDLASEMYGDGLFPSLLCPPPLFLDIISINHLRFRGSHPSLVNKFTQSAAEAVLKHIDAFSPEQWAAPNTSSLEEWLLLGRIYQSAVILYCISSLQSISVLPSTPELKIIRTVHSDRLSLLLKRALVSERIKKCLMWPLAVSGMEAVNGSLAARDCVLQQLTEMSQDLGSSLPLLAKSMFKRFWASGKTKWDDCFDTPYAFVP
ncbi:predicted protein [Uncinocarpus reesii 1704]|uniref:Zn(2)-C6 fungal-type domain-containing protein n=1 Tax=Uncinocarpus reesii (strain UAMH 1704) TaxID=336963 RepID=C4JSI6_UNCRE|nr:uncharacterized protein UREG_05425 [Uncinocarpus reesii 1704]EEP80583.1 predicted protein [Uncinocarpus reesii 1704]